MGAQKDDAAGVGPADDAPMSVPDPQPWATSISLSGDDVAPLSMGDRKAQGKAARNDVPRSSHAEVNSRVRRREPIDLLRERSLNRDPELLAMQHGRMVVSPFAYFRGALLSMTADLAGTPRTGLNAQLCGDSNISNFGVFRTPGGLAFDIADFTETASGPWEWDLKRLGASIEISGRDSDFSGDQRKTIVLGTARSYRETIRQFAAMSNLETWSARLDCDALVRRFRSLLSPDKTSSGWEIVKKANAQECHPGPDGLTRFVDGRAKILGDQPSLVPLDDIGSKTERESETSRLQRIVRSYLHTLQPQTRQLLGQYTTLEAARKAYGVSGAATESWFVLLTDTPDGTPIHLEVKQVGTSAIERSWWKQEFSSHGHRAVHGQKLIQATEDEFLGWHSDPTGDRGRDHYVRTLPDWAESSDTAGMTPASAELWGRLCGWALARAHARSGDRFAIAAYLGKSEIFDHALVKFSRHYADQNERDFGAFRRAVRKGRLVADRDG